MLLGIDNWSFGFAWGIRNEFKPSNPMNINDIISKVQEYGLKGAQIGLNDMPELGSSEYKKFKEKIDELGLFWEVSAGLISNETEVVESLDYACVLGCKVVRAFLECFGIQFKFESLDEYISGCITHLKKIMPEVEKRKLFLCLENHGGLRMEYIQRVFNTIKSEHLGICFDTGNAVLTLNDPLKAAEELAGRTYTVHLKDWKLIKTADGLLARGCSLGDGVINLPNIIEILKKHAPNPEELHMNIETAQEYIPLKILNADFWKHHSRVTGDDLRNILRLAEYCNTDPMDDYRLACMRGASEIEILAEEEDAILESIRYAKAILKL